MTDGKHITVLQSEAVDQLALTENSVVVDATLGAAGHARTIIERLGKNGTYLGIDVDPSAVTAAASLQKETQATVHLEVANFRQIKEVCTKYQVTPTAILADLGWRSQQFADSTRGFSFQEDGPLLMTYGDPESYPFTAHDMANDWEETSLADVIYGYGEERFARRIAKAIVEARSTGSIDTTHQLAEIVMSAVPGWYRRARIHPATRTFQALRIAVNDELGVLRDLIQDGFDLLRPGGRLVIITFHSLEDRIVKHSFASFKHDHGAELITKKPLTPTLDEINQNPRARSAKMRVIQK